MKNKKLCYILNFILMLLVGIGTVYAESSECTPIFGNPNDPNSLRGLINDILVYPKILVPVIIIGLGTLDLAKAVIASKEDEMRKAQATLIKRVFIGVAVFFVPTIIDLLMLVVDQVLGATGACQI